MMFELCNKGRNILPKKRYKKYSREREGFSKPMFPTFLITTSSRLCLNRGGFLLKGKEHEKFIWRRYIRE